MKTHILFILILLMSGMAFAQTGTIKGRVYDEVSNEPLPFVNLIINGTQIGSSSDLDGNFLFTGIKPGFVKIVASAIGYEPHISEEFQVTTAKSFFVNIPMKQKNIKLSEVVVSSGLFEKRDESPLSMRTIGISEIEKNPGGNRDISKVLTSLPGVSSGPAFRNDVVVRGGGASENRFYLDGVEIPNLNHFATQGASGGPVGIINVDFLREVNFYSGVFPAQYGNALSSMVDMKQIDANKDKFSVKSAIGASDLAITLNGPITGNSSIIFSARRSYLQFLFQALKLPFLPTYNDFQFKYKINIDKKNEFYIIGLGALDDSELNLNANETEEQRFILSYLPSYKQWNYTIGAVYKNYRNNGFSQLVISRNYLNNASFKYFNNDESSENNKLLDYDSDEIENKIRLENTHILGTFKVIYGAGGEYAKYYNSTYRKVYSDVGVFDFNYNSFLEVYKWSAFTQVSNRFINDKLSLSLGIRTDGNSFTSKMSDISRQISPRISLSYQLRSNLILNANSGRYYQLPPYTSLGFKNNQGIFVNQKNDIRYIGINHYVAGIEWLPDKNSQFTIEGFYKQYDHYPFSVRDSISLASKGTDFGTFGDEEIRPESEGKAYGIEILFRRKVLDNFTVISSYTLVRSMFTDKNMKYVSSAWDNIHLLNLTVTKVFNKGWFVGAKWKFVGGAPYTPFNTTLSSLKSVWDVENRGVLDYDRYNSERLKAFHQLDIRIDKEFYFKKWSLTFYLDIQNLYNFKAEQPSRLLKVYDSNGNPLIANPEAPVEEQRYVLKSLNSQTGNVLPTIGIIVEF